MGKRRPRGRQRSMWVASSQLPRSAGNPFYERLNRVLDEAGFDAFAEEQCAKFYADGVGRPSLAPGRYFRMLLLGYFEGLDSERAIAWRAADSLSLRAFLDIALHEASPDHSTVSRTRRRIEREACGQQVRVHPDRLGTCVWSRLLGRPPARPLRSWPGPRPFVAADLAAVLAAYRRAAAARYPRPWSPDQAAGPAGGPRGEAPASAKAAGNSYPSANRRLLPPPANNPH